MIVSVALVRTLFVALFATVLAFAPAHAQQAVIITTTISWTDDKADDGNARAIGEDAALLDDVHYLTREDMARFVAVN